MGEQWLVMLVGSDRGCPCLIGIDREAIGHVARMFERQ
jgi:hypothetical protein